MIKINSELRNILKDEPKIMRLKIYEILMRITPTGAILKGKTSRCTKWNDFLTIEELEFNTLKTLDKLRRILEKYDIVRISDDGLIVSPLYCICGKISELQIMNFSDLDLEDLNKFDIKRLEWGILVKEKYNKICDICGSNKYLHAHHLYSYSDNKNLRYDLNNGVCLCKDCHINGFHKEYGRKHNTKEQYYKFKVKQEKFL